MNYCKRFLALAVSVIGIFGLSGCEQEQPEPSMSLDLCDLCFDVAGGERTVSVTANRDWTAKTVADWLTIEPASGKAAEEAAEVKITAKANESVEAREATVTFKAEGVEKSVTVKQEGRIPDPEMALDKTELAFEAAGGEQTVAVTANRDWTAETAADWVTIVPASGKAAEAAAEVKITVKANESVAAREAVVTLKAEGVEKSVTVKQEGRIPDPAMTLDKTELAFEAAGGEQTVAVTANRDWTAKTAADWVTIEPAAGKAAEEAAEVKITAKANESVEARETTVTFKAEGVEKSLTVTQAGKLPSSVLIETAFGMELELVPVEGGTFWMGAQSTDDAEQNYDSEAFLDETPVHRVTLSDYYIGKHEVTQGQWKAVMGTNPSYFKKGDDYPVENVSWDNIQSFIQKLNEKTGRHYALPTEAQWEYAARGGNCAAGTKYSGSANVDEVAWYGLNSGSTTHPVGTKSPNELGLYDMSGNVWEWCADRYGGYSSGVQTNPQGPSSGSCRILRGGGWHDSGAGGCRVSFRHYLTPDTRYGGFGFRLALLP